MIIGGAAPARAAGNAVHRISAVCSPGPGRFIVEITTVVTGFPS
jgi:hypothetical protein